MIAVDPDQVTRLELFKERVRVGLVRLLVGGIPFILNRNLGGNILPEEVVEERPES